MELRCPECASPEVEHDPKGGDEARRCANCGARFRRASAFVTVQEANGLAAGRAADSERLDRIAAFMNRLGPWSGGDVCEYVAEELRASGRRLLDE